MIGEQKLPSYLLLVLHDLSTFLPVPRVLIFGQHP